MKKFILVMVIINTSLLLLGGGIFGLGLLLGGKNNFGFDIKNKVFVEPIYINEYYDLDDFSSMKIDIEMGKLYIEESDKCRIEYRLLEEAIPDIKVEDETLIITHKDNKVIPINIMNIDSEEQYIKLYVTKDQYAEIKTSSGGMEIKNVNIDGVIEGSSGGVSITGSEADNLDIKVSSGRTTLDNVKYEDLKANQSSGKFVIKNAEVGNLYARSLSGGIEFENVTAETIEGNSTSGGIDFTKVSAKSANLDANSGSIKMDGCEIENLTADSTSGGVKAEDTKIDNADLDVSSGGVKLNLIGDVNDYDFDLDVSSGSINVNDEKKNSKFITNDGKGKKIKAETSSGSINININ